MVGNFFPSIIENNIYEIMEDYIKGIDIYEYQLTDVIGDYFINHNIEFQLVCSDWSDHSGGICSFSWMENGHSHLIVFEYIY